MSMLKLLSPHNFDRQCHYHTRCRKKLKKKLKMEKLEQISGILSNIQQELTEIERRQLRTEKKIDEILKLFDERKKAFVFEPAKTLDEFLAFEQALSDNSKVLEVQKELQSKPFNGTNLLGLFLSEEVIVKYNFSGKIVKGFKALSFKTTNLFSKVFLRKYTFILNLSFVY